MIAQMRGFCNARKRFTFPISRHLSAVKTAFPFRKAAIIFHFSPAQAILSIHLRECRPKAFPECGIAPALPAAWHIRQSAHTPNLLFCTRRIALHAVRQYCICRVIHRIRLKTIFLPSPAKIQAKPMPVGWRPFPGVLGEKLLTGHLIRPPPSHPPKSTESSHHPAADTAE